MGCYYNIKNGDTRFFVFRRPNLLKKFEEASKKDKYLRFDSFAGEAQDSEAFVLLAHSLPGKGKNIFRRKKSRGILPALSLHPHCVLHTNFGEDLAHRPFELMTCGLATPRDSNGGGGGGGGGDTSSSSSLSSMSGLLLPERTSGRDDAAGGGVKLFPVYAASGTEQVEESVRNDEVDMDFEAVAGPVGTTLVDEEADAYFKSKYFSSHHVLSRDGVPCVGTPNLHAYFPRGVGPVDAYATRQVVTSVDPSDWYPVPDDYVDTLSTDTDRPAGYCLEIRMSKETKAVVTTSAEELDSIMSDYLLRARPGSAAAAGAGAGAGAGDGSEKEWSRKKSQQSAPFPFSRSARIAPEEEASSNENKPLASSVPATSVVPFAPGSLYTSARFEGLNCVDQLLNCFKSFAASELKSLQQISLTGFQNVTSSSLHDLIGLFMNAQTFPELVYLSIENIEHEQQNRGGGKSAGSSITNLFPEDSSNLKKLRYVSFRHAHLSSEDVRHFSRSLSKMHLHHLVLSGNKVDHAIEEVADAIGTCRTLLHFDISDCAISSAAGMLSLCEAILENEGMQYLNFNGCKFGGAGALPLARTVLSLHQGVRVLSLRSNYFGARGMKHLANGISLSFFLSFFFTGTFLSLIPVYFFISALPVCFFLSFFLTGIRLSSFLS